MSEPRTIDRIKGEYDSRFADRVRTYFLHHPDEWERYITWVVHHDRIGSCLPDCAGHDRAPRINVVEGAAPAENVDGAGKWRGVWIPSSRRRAGTK